ncbi:MAG: DUF5615 family PIN-like protein [Myxococcota bacterium]|nr:DUF5615 family PIN-like protein [Myxococcota bacterium]
MNVKLLLDENLSPRVAETLIREDGVDAVHVRDRGLLGALDRRVLDAAFAEDRVLVTSNVDDFVTLARAREVHSGIVLIEDGGLLREEQLQVVRKAIAVLQGERDLVNGVLRIWLDGHVIFEEIPPPTEHVGHQQGLPPSAPGAFSRSVFAASFSSMRGPVNEAQRGPRESDVESHRDPSVHVQPYGRLGPPAPPSVVEDRTCQDDDRLAHERNEDRPIDQPQPPAIVRAHGALPARTLTIVQTNVLTFDQRLFWGLGHLLVVAEQGVELVCRRPARVRHNGRLVAKKAGRHRVRVLADVLCGLVDRVFAALAAERNRVPAAGSPIGCVMWVSTS